MIGMHVIKVQSFRLHNLNDLRGKKVVILSQQKTGVGSSCLLQFFLFSSLLCLLCQIWPLSDTIMGRSVFPGARIFVSVIFFLSLAFFFSFVYVSCAFLQQRLELQMI